MSQVQARFYLIEVARISYYGTGKSVEATKVKMAPVRGEPFGPATPQGTFEALIVNPEAAAVFLSAPINSEFDVFIAPIPKESA